MYYDFWRKYYTAFSRTQNLLVLTCAGRETSYFTQVCSNQKNYQEIEYQDFEFPSVKPVSLKDT